MQRCAPIPARLNGTRGTGTGHGVRKQSSAPSACWRACCPLYLAIRTSNCVAATAAHWNASPTCCINYRRTRATHCPADAADGSGLTLNTGMGTPCCDILPPGASTLATATMLASFCRQGRKDTVTSADASPQPKPKEEMAGKGVVVPPVLDLFLSPEWQVHSALRRAFFPCDKSLESLRSLQLPCAALTASCCRATGWTSRA